MLNTSSFKDNKLNISIQKKHLLQLQTTFKKHTTLFAVYSFLALMIKS